MSPIEELEGLLSGPSRVVTIAQRDVDLQSLAGENHLVLLKMVEGSLAAGGRGGGFGERRVVKAVYYRYLDGNCEKLFETQDESQAATFEIPYFVARMPIVLRDGAQSMVYGVVEEELVRQIVSKIEQASSA
jgi:hypothetical protein